MKKYVALLQVGVYQSEKGNCGIFSALFEASPDMLLIALIGVMPKR